MSYQRRCHSTYRRDDEIGEFAGSHWCVVSKLTLLAGLNLVVSDALDVKLTEEEVKYLEDAYQPRRVIGHV